ncbi:hypothetical protein [Listeria costaricensis]|uniref:hypothetical protein n=1 Tax=Listeria costaricensis TaxID=2026604 RepID=UPI0013C465F1|nr:hypothetical protein [Listeria costaricensis]
MNIDQLRMAAGKSLKGNWGLAIGSLMLTGIIYTGVHYLCLFIFSFSTVLRILFTLLLVFPLYVGLFFLFLEIARGKKIDIGHLFIGYRHYFRIILTGILMILLIGLWSLLFIVPGVIKCFSYSQTFYYLLDEPDLSPLQAIKKSTESMQGSIWLLCRLSLITYGIWFLIPLIFYFGGLIALSHQSGYLYASSVDQQLFFMSLLILILGSIVQLVLYLLLFPRFLTALAHFHLETAQIPVREPAPSTD